MPQERDIPGARQDPPPPLSHDLDLEQPIEREMEMETSEDEAQPNMGETWRRWSTLNIRRRQIRSRY